MKNKKKKKIIKKLKNIIESNRNFCTHHELRPTDYIQGSNDVAKLMIRYINKFKQKLWKI